MIPELGHFALIVALLLAAAQAIFGLAGGARGTADWMAAARSAALGQLAFVAFAFAALLWSFAHNDFSVLNVASNSNSRLPVHYRLTAAWGSHEGSLLLWALVMAGWTAAVALLSRRLPASVRARAQAGTGTIRRPGPVRCDQIALERPQQPGHAVRSPGSAPTNIRRRRRTAP